MNHDEEMRKQYNYGREKKEKAEKAAQNKMRDRLKSIADIKINTTMVFPLSQFETVFGYLWGHGKPDEALTKEELICKTKWLEIRNSILNNGNQQKRNLRSEIDMHNVTWKRYNVQFKPKKIGDSHE